MLFLIIKTIILFVSSAFLSDVKFSFLNIPSISKRFAPNA